MNKSELIAMVAKNAGTTNRDAEAVLEAFRDVVQVNVKGGNDVSYPGLGKFARADRKARIARNPRTGEEVKVKATKVPRFSASAELKRVVAGDSPAPRLVR
jgi:DNA-binding protein HU-beta